MSERRDPTLGALPDLERVAARVPVVAQRGSQRAQPRRRRWPWLVAAIVAIALAFALYRWRDVLGARLVPPPEQTHTMQLADAALRAGNLSSPDGRGARELYAAILARDPDHLAAREGLVRVGAAALAQAQSAMHAKRPRDARRALELARSLAVPTADLQPIEDALRQGDGSDDRLATLLAQADAAEHAGHLDDGDASALARYQQALSAAPDNAVVLAHRQALLARMLGGIDASLAQGDTAGAQKLVERVAAVDPGHLDLPAARARLGEGMQQRQNAQAHALDAADADLRAGRIDAAVSTYRKVIAQTPDNLRAHGGLRSAGEAWLAAANHAVADFDFIHAETALAQARALTPELPALRAAEQHLQQARAHRSSIPTAANKATIDDLLAAADHAIVRDELVDPPGDSAFDKLRAASAIAPGDPRVIEATKRFGVTAIACFQREMTGNRLARAEACFDALIATQPAYPQLPSMRQNLAARWLAVADERLGAGELDNAQRAIASAQRWSPNDSAIPALKTRLQQARAGSHH